MKKPFLNFDQFLSESLKDPAVKREYDRLEPEFLVASALIELRQKKRLTQTTLAQMAQLDQSEIARIESGSRNVTVRTLHKIATATGARLTISLLD